jgi:Peptidase family M28
MLNSLLDTLTGHFSGSRALQIATEIQRTDRWSSWHRYRETADYCVATMRAAGLTAEWRELPSDGKTVCGDWIMPRAWDAHAARLWLLRDGASELICDYEVEPCCLAMWSSPTPPGGADYEVVHLDRADQESAFLGVDLRGRILFTGSPARVAKPIASRLGAMGIISDAASRHGRREAFELPDAVTWENSWKDRAQGGWGCAAADRECFAFLLSPRQGVHFRGWLRSQSAPRVRALVATDLYEGTTPAVTGFLPGTTGEQVVAVGHLFEQGAVDNASGPAVIMEGLRALRELIDAGRLPRPRRTIRALFAVECAGTYGCVELQPELLAGAVAGVNVDCVGGRLDAMRAPINLRRNPDATSSFTDSLLAHALKSAARRLDYPIRVQTGRWLLDDNLIADPAIGIPCPLFGSWPYPAYHNSADDPSLLDPRGLSFAGIATAAYLYTIAAAEAPTACRLARLAGTESRAALARSLMDVADTGPVDAERAVYGAHRAIDSVRSTLALAPEATEVAAEVQRQETGILRTLEIELAAAGFAGSLPTPPPPAGRVPRRRVRGTFQAARVPAEHLDAWRERMRSARATGDVPDCALFWADGRRTIGEIAWLVRHDLGVPAPDLDALFDGLAEYGYVEFVGGSG